MMPAPTWTTTLMQEEFRRVLDRFEQVKNERSNFNSHWQAIAEVLTPAGAIFLEETPSSQGVKNGRRVYDTTGTHANELLSSGFFSLLTSPTLPWFMLQTNIKQLNDIWAVQVWLDNVTRTLMYEIQRPQTGFTAAMHEFYLEYGAFGNATMFVTEALNRESLLFQTLPMAECFYVENDEGRVDTLFRRYWRTPYQLFERFGKNLHPKVLTELDKPNSTQRFEVIHAIMPNKYAQTTAHLATDLPYLSAYLDKGNRFVMSVSGFEELPFMAARFYKMPQEIYGRGPGSIALPDVEMLQEMMATVLRGAQKMVDPPLQMPDQGFIAPPNTAPGRVNYFRTGTADTDKIAPIQTGGRPDLGMDIVQSIQNRVREIFFVDQLQLNIGPQMTATEVMQRTEEKQRLMGPVIGRASSELLSPMIVRAFGLLMRAGALPPPPAELEEALANGARLKIVYTSPIFKSQEQVGANNITRATQVLLPFIQADPTIMDVFHSQRMAKGVGEMFNVPAEFFRTDEEVQQAQQARQQAQQQQAQAEMLKNQGIGLNNIAGAAQRIGQM